MVFEKANHFQCDTESLIIVIVINCNYHSVLRKELN